MFIDSDRGTWNLDPNLLEDELKRRTASGETMPKALIVTHIYGQPAEMDSIVSICDKYGVSIIEDAAESLGASFDGKQTGGFRQMRHFFLLMPIRSSLPAAVEYWLVMMLS